eukprot:RCo002990
MLRCGVSRFVASGLCASRGVPFSGHSTIPFPGLRPSKSVRQFSWKFWQSATSASPATTSSELSQLPEASPTPQLPVESPATVAMPSLPSATEAVSDSVATAVSDGATTAAAAADGMAQLGWVGGALFEIMRGVQETMGIPEWAATMVVALALRLFLFPFVVKNKTLGLHLNRARSVVQAYQSQLQMIQNSGVQLTQTQLKELGAARDAELDKVHPGLRIWKPFALLVPISVPQLALFIGFRRYFQPGVASGSFLWVPDLTQGDPYGGLPICFALSLAGVLGMMLRSQTSGLNGPPTPFAVQLSKYMLLGMPPIAAVGTALFPSGMVLYFVANTGCLLLQAGLLESVSVRRALDIPVLSDETQTSNPYIVPATPTVGGPAPGTDASASAVEEAKKP